jgi:hypothetical protein
MRSPSAALLLIGCVIGCTQASIPHTNPGRPRLTSSDASAVTGLELAHAAQSGDLMAMLQRMRPSFLRTRGATPIVSIDGVVFADLSVLRTIQVADVCAVRLRRGTSEAGESAILPNGRVSSNGDYIEVSLRSRATTPCPRD